MRVLWLVEKFPWMGNHSGYELLCQHFSNDVKGNCIYRDHASENNNPEQECLDIAPGTFYTRSSYLVEKKCIHEVKNGSYDICHILYGDTNFSALSAKIKETGVKVIISVHQPSSWWQATHQKHNVLSLADGVITMSNSCIPFLKEYVSEDCIKVIPHGVDIDFWAKGAKNSSSMPYCIVVGHWLRDFACIFGVVRRLHSERFPLRFKFVLPNLQRQKNIVDGLREIPTCEVLHDITDEALRDQYHNACALFLPLKDATANNAVLEAMACGCPVVTSNVEGLITYLGENWPLFYKNNDIDGFCDALKNIAGNKSVRQHYSSLILDRIKDLSWEKVAQETVLFYKRILAFSQTMV